MLILPFSARYLLFPLLIFLLEGCASFDRVPPPLLLSQSPPSRPLFVSHMPESTGKADFFSGHSVMEPSLRAARTIALGQTFNAFARFLRKQGYTLTKLERTWWLTQAVGSPGGPSIVDSWIRVYKESSDRPYIHRTSVYLLVAVPKSFTKKIIGNMAAKDRLHRNRANSEEVLARQALEDSDGSDFLYHLSIARNEYRRIHSLRSFPLGDRPSLHRKQIEADALWRRSLRAMHLSIAPSHKPFYLTSEGRNLPMVLESARLDSDNSEKSFRLKGLSGLTLSLSLHPETRPESLVFPSLAWLFGNNRPILSRSVLDWETHLFRPSPYLSLSAFRYLCGPTDRKGAGQCSFQKGWVPGTSGYLEGVYRPVPGSRLDSEYFRSLFAKTLLEEHFVYYRRRLLHPILLSLENLPPDRKEGVRKILIAQSAFLDFNICRKTPKQEIPSCSRDLPHQIISSSMPVLRLSLEHESIHSWTKRNILLKERHIMLREELSDSQGVFWIKRADVRSLGLSSGEAGLYAWKEIGRRLARDLDQFYYRKRELRTGEDFYER